jgi:hypothetical protein
MFICFVISVITRITKYTLSTTVINLHVFEYTHTPLYVVDRWLINLYVGRVYLLRAVSLSLYVYIDGPCIN